MYRYVTVTTATINCFKFIANYVLNYSEFVVYNEIVSNNVSKFKVRTNSKMGYRNVFAMTALEKSTRK